MEAAALREEIRVALLADGQPPRLAERIAAVSEASFLMLRDLEQLEHASGARETA